MTTDKNTPSIEALQAQVADLCHSLEVTNRAIVEDKQELVWYKARVEWFMRNTFRRNSEKLVNPVDQRQQTLFAVEVAATISQAPETTTVTDTWQEKSCIKTGLRFAPDVPVKVIPLELP